MTPSEHGEHQRTQIAAVIRANPGIHIRQLAAVTGVSWGTCLHHTRRLKEAGRIASRKLRGLCCFFDLSQGSVSSRIGAALLRNPTRNRIARQVAADPGTIQRDLAEALGMACSVVHRQLVALESAALVRRVPSGRGVAVFPSDDLGLLLAVPSAETPKAVSDAWTNTWEGNSPGLHAFGHGYDSRALDAPVDLAALGVPA